MSRERKTETAPVQMETEQAAPAIEFINNVNVPIEVREEIIKKAEALKAVYRLSAPPQPHALQSVYELRSEGRGSGKQDACHQRIPRRRS